MPHAEPAVRQRGSACLNVCCAAAEKQKHVCWSLLYVLALSLVLAPHDAMANGAGDHVGVILSLGHLSLGSRCFETGTDFISCQCVAIGL